jgi:hypothetical protein
MFTFNNKQAKIITSISSYVFLVTWK